LSEEKKISRRAYLKYAGGVVAVGAIAAAGYGAYQFYGKPVTTSPTTPTSTLTPTVTTTPTTGGQKLTVSAHPLDHKSFLSSLI
jgi:hypothetical protein